MKSISICALAYLEGDFIGTNKQRAQTLPNRYVLDKPKWAPNIANKTNYTSHTRWCTHGICTCLVLFAQNFMAMAHMLETHTHPTENWRDKWYR